MHTSPFLRSSPIHLDYLHTFLTHEFLHKRLHLRQGRRAGCKVRETTMKKRMKRSENRIVGGALGECLFAREANSFPRVRCCAAFLFSVLPTHAVSR